MKRYFMGYPGEPEIEDAEGDWVVAEEALAEIERLRAALFRHACYCGCGSPEPGLHRENCAYRVACTPHPKADVPT